METLKRRADHEGPAVSLGFVVFDQAEALDHREPRTSAHFGDEGLDRRGRPSDERLDRAVDRLRTQPDTFNLSAARRVNSR